MGSSLSPLSFRDLELDELCTGWCPGCWISWILKGPSVRKRQVTLEALSLAKLIWRTWHKVMPGACCPPTAPPWTAPVPESGADPSTVGQGELEDWRIQDWRFRGWANVILLLPLVRAVTCYLYHLEMVDGATPQLPCIGYCSILWLPSKVPSGSFWKCLAISFPPGVNTLDLRGYITTSLKRGKVYYATFLAQSGMQPFRRTGIWTTVASLFWAGNSSTSGLPFLSTVKRGNTQSPVQSMTMVARTSSCGSLVHDMAVFTIGPSSSFPMSFPLDFSTRDSTANGWGGAAVVRLTLVFLVEASMGAGTSPRLGQWDLQVEAARKK